MSRAELQLTYSAEDEWLGQLTAVVRSGAFAGQSSAWFDRLDLKKTFVARLRMFPLSSTLPPQIEGGFWSKTNSGRIDQGHLRIVMTPYNRRGTLLVRVDLTSHSWETPDVDRQQSVTARFLTEYAATDLFSEEVERVLDGARGRAVLKGDPM